MKDNLLQSSLRMCLVEFKYDVMTALEKDVQFATNFAWILIGKVLMQRKLEIKK